MPTSNNFLRFADFLRYSHTFIETGTFYGQGVLLALEAGFARVRTVEADSFIFEKATEILGNLALVEQYHGESTTMLPSMLFDIDCPCVFWLDAHAAGEGTFAHADVMKKRSESEFAQDKILTKELEIILNHRTDHILLLDDQYGENPENIRYRETLLRANQNYTFTFMDRQEGETLYKDKVLVCIPS